MNRFLGVSTGAILLLGMVLRPGSAPAPKSEEPSARTTPISARSASARTAFAATGKTLTGEGPWVASCRYWETSTGIQYPAKKDIEGNVPAQSKGDKGTTSKGKTPEGKNNSECERNGDAWGIPVPPAPAKARSQARFIPLVKPDITAIVAAVPDPIHTHLALQFDRDIDAILQAAAENGYLPSQYWLPWTLPQENLATGTSAAAASDEAEQTGREQTGREQTGREQQPGLIVLKYASQTSSPQSYDWRSYDRVIYLFIVGESPASGMNGAQLRNALRYEALLRRGYPSARISLSTRGTGDLAVIGSPNSDSAVSLREAIEAAKDDLKVTSVHIAGSTETEQANDALQVAFDHSSTPVRYVSFGEDFEYEKHETLNLLSNSGYDTDRVAFLVEDGTVFGDEGGAAIKGFSSGAGGKGLPPLIIRFPREISLLRNAQSKNATSSAPSPYLQLTLKDSSANDTVPHFSSEQTPLSQEAALMSIQRELVAYHAQFLAIQATNMLDKIYLANYFHRACPNIRLVFLGGGDLLLEREVDNVPYIGSVTMTPYNLVGLLRFPPLQTVSRAFPDSVSESMFNAASYTFEPPRALETGTNPMLAGYEASRDANAKSSAHASLWATVIGSDGYYPLGVASSCASDSPQSLPSFAAGEPQPCVVKDRYAAASPGRPSASDEMQQFARTAALFPSLMWTALSILLGVYCAGHGAVLLAAGFWSPFTRDLAIGSNDQPTRRSVYMNIGTAMLFSMVFVLEWPAFCIGPVLKLNRASTGIACAVLAAGLLAVVATLAKTWRYSFPKSGVRGLAVFNTWQAACSFFNVVAGVALFVIPAVWAHLCSLNTLGELHTNYGVFFSYRCLHPDSQVSPAVPVLLVLLGWYSWAFCQTCRLRFSQGSRPRLPGRIVTSAPLPLYVADEDLDVCETPQDPRLFENLTCLLITRELLARFAPKLKPFVGFALAVGYVSIFGLLMSFRSIESVDRMVLDRHQHPTSYEALMVALTGSLLTIGLAGWIRLMLVWSSLRRGLLERLEMYPLRAAFTRLKGVGWVAMLRDTGLHTRWRDMARANESIRQLHNNGELIAAISNPSPAARFEFRNRYRRLEEDIHDVYGLVKDKQPDDPLRCARLRVAGGDLDLPKDGDILALELLTAIETDYAVVCEILLKSVLIPYWLTKRGGFVEGDSHESAPIHAKRKAAAAQPHDAIELHAASASGDPEHIRLAEELLALRYLSLIRAVLANVRYLMTFVSAAFVLSLVAWNSYPFQPRELVDWAFTFAFVLLFGGIVMVFAQMHRNALLSRITDTAPNELGFAFYWRLVTFGAIPLLTWLSYQFPQAWSGIFRLLQPGLSAMK